MAKFLQSIKQKRMLVVLLLGFSSGLPLGLATGGTLQNWLTNAGLSLGLIGFSAFLGLPYTLKFLWAPVFDRYVPSFLGRRRGWMAILQLIIALIVAWMSTIDPAQDIVFFGLVALLCAFASASQDIVIDAFTNESFPKEELGLASAQYILGYRIASQFIGGALAMMLADYLTWPQVYLIMAAFMGIGGIATWIADEPKQTETSPQNMQEAVFDPFLEYFRRKGAWIILIFILLYKVGDVLAGSMIIPFVQDRGLGFTKTEYAAIVKIFGFWAILAGVFLGGASILKFGVNRCLWIFGAFQMISTAGFALLAISPKSIPLLAAVIAIENLTGGLGTAAFMAFMRGLTHKKYTATQYALLSSLMGIPRVILASSTGFLAESMGWPLFFVACTLAALPAFLVLGAVAPWRTTSA